GWVLRHRLNLTFLGDRWGRPRRSEGGRPQRLPPSRPRGTEPKLLDGRHGDKRPKGADRSAAAAPRGRRQSRDRGPSPWRRRRAEAARSGPDRDGPPRPCGKIVLLRKIHPVKLSV